MAVTSKTRKMLWGRSGNRCAICRRELVMSASQGESDSVIGEECHIVAREKKGPRGDSTLPDEFRDRPDNLILLCRNHHKIIDDQPNIFTVEVLFSIKSKHEAWVRNSLAQKKGSNPELFYAYRIDDGTQLWNTVIECDAYTFDTAHPQTREEANILGEFTQSIKDYGDIWNVIENRDRVLYQFELGKEIKELNDSSFLVYATSRPRKFSSGNKEGSMELMIGYVVILRKENPILKRKDDEIETMMQVRGQTQSIYSNFIPIMLDAKYFRFV